LIEFDERNLDDKYKKQIYEWSLNNIIDLNNSVDKKKQMNLKINNKNFEKIDDKESSWCKYVGFEKYNEVNEEKGILINPLSNSINNNINKQNFLKKKHYSESFINKELLEKEKSILNNNNKYNLIKKGNYSESDGNINFFSEKKSKIQSQRINDISENNFFNYKFFEENLNKKNNHIKSEQSENSNFQKQIPLSSFRSIQISTEPPLPSYKEEKEKIFQVQSIPKFKKQKEIIKNRERYFENINYLNAMNEKNNDDKYGKNNFFIKKKTLEPNSSLFENDSNNGLTIKKQFKFDNFNDNEIQNKKRKEISDIKPKNDSFSLFLKKFNPDIDETKDFTKHIYNENYFENQFILEKNYKRNDSGNKGQTNLLKNKIIITKKEGKIIIKSVPKKNQE
jgi:hypothetical protein